MDLTKYGINERIRFIQRGWVSANSILITGDAPVIFDTGHHSLAHELPPLMAKEGVAAESLTKIVNTHGHWDHHSGNDALRALSGATVYMGALTAEWMRTRNGHDSWMSYFGVPPVYSLPDEVISAETTLNLGGFTWQVIPLPGHSPDLLGFYEPNEQVLICADALLPNGDMGVLNVMVHGWEALDHAEASIERMLGLTIRVALPGHGPIITKVESNLLALQQRLLQFRREPERLVRHFTRRIVMAYLLEVAPMTYEQALEVALNFPWVEDYEPYFGDSAENTFKRTINELIRGRAIRVVDNLLISQVPR
ncbi:MAG: MBL fold metallo-hydrolase [Candidatus Promineifilaceae bacterium]